jgi:hypothetical protein
LSTTAIVLIVVLAVIVLGVLAFFAVEQAKRRRLRSRFGPEYDRMLESSKDRRTAERELADRERRHRQLDLRPISPADREQYTQQWAQVQERFVDDPERAVHEADQLVMMLMQARGYPAGSFDQRAAHLSVEHGSTISEYREAHALLARHEQGDESSTEDLRAALLHYRTLVRDLLKAGTDHQRATNGDDTAGTDTTGRRSERV